MVRPWLIDSLLIFNPKRRVKKWKWKNTIIPTTYPFPFFSPFGLSHKRFLKSALVTQILPMRIHLKIYAIIIYPFSVFLFEYFDFLKCFCCYWPYLIGFFLKDFQARTSHIFMTKKPKKTEDRQYIGSIISSRITNLCKLFKPNKPKEHLSF